YTVAARLNARFADTSASCTDGSPAYFCNGVLVRSTGVGDFHAWNPSDDSIRGNGVSFNFFRADQGNTRTYTPQGYVLHEIAAPVSYPLSVRCLYPFDAKTSNRADKCDFQPPCAPTIVTAEQWLARYAGSINTSCYMEGNIEGVKLSSDIRQSGEVDLAQWNEWIIATWPQDIGGQLPIQAFFHSDKVAVPGNGPVGARYYQREYLQIDRRYLPIVALHPLATDGQVFSYSPQDQDVD
ncbi:hypothetical protein UB47_25270, partial [Pseudomonas sp. 5]